ncbi:MAG: RBBP9/YdeN family alpha/beta hydrolase [Janthinobacterium lividum]
MTTVLLVPGLGNSGSQHWQTKWAEHYRYPRVEQHDWEQPVCTDWVQALHEAIGQVNGEVILVAHSLGCSTVAHWTQQFPQGAVVGALLVAPADVDRPDFPPEVTGFAPMPLQPLPFPSMVVASSNDEYVTLPRATDFAAAWDSLLVNVGELGHLNSDSNFGEWPEGHRLLMQLLGEVTS